MTHENQDAREETPHPVSTRHHEDRVESDDELPPPFIPGAAAPAAPGAGAGSTVDMDAAEEAEAAVEAQAAVEMEREDPWAGAEQAEAPAEPGATAEPEATAERADGVAGEEPFPFDMPWEEETDEFQEEPVAGGHGEETHEEPAFGEPTGGPAFDEPVLDRAAYDEASQEEAALYGETAYQPPVSPAPGEAEALPGSMSERDQVEEEMADLLDELAATLRLQGVDALKDRMDSPDRITSLLAGLIAGYISGRS